jgi:hypothetical protein
MPKGENLKGKGGVKFGSGQPTNLGGRPKKIYTILKEKGFSEDDIKTCFKEIAFYDKKELLEVVNRSDVPVITIVVANAFINAASKGKWTYIKEIMEHIIGRPVQRNEHTGKDGDGIKFVLPKPTDDLTSDEIK